MPRLSSFCIHSKNIFLTYPHCSVSKEDALSQLKGLFKTGLPSYYIRVSSELQVDGSPHLHCLLQFPYKFETQNQRFFDLVSGSRSTHFHPDIQGARNDAAVLDYKLKYDEYIDDGEFRTSGKAFEEEAYRRALCAHSKEEALNILKAAGPKSFFLHFKRIVRNLESIFKLPPEEYHSPFSDFQQLPDVLKEWAKANIRNTEDRPPHRPISLILEGPSGTGKTCWARSLGRHNYYAGHIDLRNHNDEALYNVIDGIKPAFLKQWKELIGAKEDWVSNLRYGKLKKIKGGIPSIILCNLGPRTSFKSFLDKDKNTGLREWTQINAEFIFITESLFCSENQTIAQNS